MPRPPDDSPPDPRPTGLADGSAAGWSAAPVIGDGPLPRCESPTPADTATWSERTHEAPEAPAAARYTVGRLLGQGGMGRVHAAVDLRLDREVALKEALPGTEARLAREARVTARLDHPNIVPVHDAGRSAEGRAFYAMRLVRGRSLAAALEAAPDAAARLRHIRTLLAVAEAVAFAHARGVVHRDLKPANILMGEFGETQVMDWGVARVLGRAEIAEGAAVATTDPNVSDPPDAELTAVGGIVGTPRYMSPEQARGERVDARADVWSLGVILYELLAGAPPYVGPPEGALAAARTGVVPDLRLRAPAAPVELVAVALRAPKPDPAARYSTARAFAADLEAWLDGRPVEAHAYTPRELIGRLLRAWRVPLGVGAVATVLLLAGAAVATIRVVSERNRAREAEAATQAALTDAEGSLAGALVQRALTALDADDPATAELAAARALTIRESPEARGVLAAYALGSRPRLISRVSAPACDAAVMGSDPREVWCQDGQGSGLWDTRSQAWRWRVDGGRAAVAGGRAYTYTADVQYAAPTVRDLATGAPLPGAFAPLQGVVVGAGLAGGALLADMGRVRLLEEGPVEAPVIGTCADGARPQAGRSVDPWQIVACYDGSLLVWSTDGGPMRTLPSVMPSPTALGVQGDTLIVGNAGGAMAVVHLRTGARGAAGDSGLGPVRAIEPWPGGGVVVLGDRGVGWWDTDTASLRLRLVRADLRAMRVVNGELWLLGTALERWSAPAALPARVLRNPNGVGGVAVDAAGERLLAYGGGGDVRVWSVADGRLLGDHRVQDGVTKAAAFGPGEGVVAVSASAPTLVWHERGKATAPDAFRDLRFKRVLVLRSGWTALFGYGFETTFARWGASEPGGGVSFGGSILDAALGPDGTFGVALDDLGDVWRIEGDPPRARRLFTDPAPGAIAASANRVAVLSQGEVRVYDDAGVRIAAMRGARLRDVAMSPDGRWVAAGDAGGRTWLWDVDTRSLRALLHGHSARVQGVAFSADGEWLATGSWDGTTRRWGLRALDADPVALQATLEAAWGGTLESLSGG